MTARVQPMTVSSGDDVDRSDARRLFIRVFWLTLILKLALSALVPLTGDEAYFVLWGRNPDYGYYDHPPMCGWLVHLMLYMGSAPVFLRFPAVLFGQLVGLGIYLVARRTAPSVASPAAVLYLLTPLNILNVLITTDTALYLFAFCSAVLFAFAMKTGRWALFAAAGALLGMALLSKYFAVLLAAAFFVQVAILDRSRRAWGGLVVAALCATPFAFLHLVWNYNHAWATVTFNAFSRGEGFSAWNIPLLAVMALYLVTPAAAWYLLRHRRELRRPFADATTTTFAVAILVPLAAFALVACTKAVGLHWVLSFVPFFFLLLPLWLSHSEFARLVRLTTVFTLAHIAIVVTALCLPLDLWRNHPAYHSILEGVRPDALSRMLEPFRDRFILATRSYSRSSVLSYHLGTNVIVFGGGSIHGRQFDLVTDFRTFDGRDILLIETDRPPADFQADFFRGTRILPIRLEDATYYLVLGHEFRYKRYRKKVLLPIVKKYYTPRSWLPRGHNPLKERYFAAGASHRP